VSQLLKQIQQLTSSLQQETKHSFNTHQRQKKNIKALVNWQLSDAISSPEEYGHGSQQVKYTEDRLPVKHDLSIV
jgi:hypothetical protein